MRPSSAVLVLTLGLAACGGGPAPTSTSAPTRAPAAAASFTPTPVLTAPRFRSGQLWRTYRGEEVAGTVFETAVAYLDEAARERYRLHGRDGLLVDGTGAPLNPPPSEGDPLRAVWVIDPAGNVYASFEQKKGLFHHSSLVAGGPVAAAGEMVIDQGRPIEITNVSGHYRPPPATLDVMKERLGEMGVDFGATRFAIFGVDVGG